MCGSNSHPDREAQRAIRERTKLTIENLERRIRDLTSQQPYQELQAVIRAKEAVEAENADIKRRLASVIGMLQPLVAPSPLPLAVPPPAAATPASTTTTNGPPPPSSSNNNNAAVTTTTAATTATTMSTPSSAASPPSTSADPYGGGHHHNSQNPWNATAAATYRAQLNQQRHDLAHGLELGTERLGLEFLLDQHKGVLSSTGGVGPNSSSSSSGSGNNRMLHHPPPHPHHSHSPYAVIHSPSHHHHSTRLDPALHNNIDPALQSAIDPALSSSPPPPPPLSSSSNHHQPTQHAIPVKNCAPTCPLDNLLLDFLHERRQRAAQGFPTHDILGPRYPSVSSLLNPLREAHPLSKVFIEILHTFPTISQLPERVATLYVMFLLMRWQIHPSADNYDRLPAWVRPGAAQLRHAHPAWVDHLPFPAMRERLVREYPAPDHVFPFEHFFVPFTTTLSLNWPYEDTDTLLLQEAGGGGDGVTDELVINPVFERHLRRLENWTLGDAFARALPMLDGTYNYRADSGPAGTTTVGPPGASSSTSSRGTTTRRDSGGRNAR